MFQLLHQSKYIMNNKNAADHPSTHQSIHPSIHQLIFHLHFPKPSVHPSTSSYHIIPPSTCLFTHLSIHPSTSPTLQDQSVQWGDRMTPPSGLTPLDVGVAPQSHCHCLFVPQVDEESMASMLADFVACPPDDEDGASGSNQSWAQSTRDRSDWQAAGTLLLFSKTPSHRENISRDNISSSSSWGFFMLPISSFSVWTTSGRGRTVRLLMQDLIVLVFFDPSGNAGPTVQTVFSDLFSIHVSLFVTHL